MDAAWLILPCASDKTGDRSMSTGTVLFRATSRREVARYDLIAEMTGKEE